MTEDRAEDIGYRHRYTQMNSCGGSKEKYSLDHFNFLSGIRSKLQAESKVRGGAGGLRRKEHVMISYLRKQGGG